MQLHYNILWIDNDIDDYISTGEVDSIKTFLLDLGFEPTIITIDDEEKLEDKIHILKYDLIISDFNLNRFVTKRNFQQKFSFIPLKRISETTLKFLRD